jgi:uncharacterized protein YbbC (DUF1343 family)
MRQVRLLVLSLAAATSFVPSTCPGQSTAAILDTLLGDPIAGAEVVTELVPALAPEPELEERIGVLTGAEILLRDSLHLVRGKRVGLITNPTALTRDRLHTIDLLSSHPEVRVQALFAPEHGLRGGIDAGVHITNGRDPESGLPVRSIYGRTQKPTPEMLRDIDVLLFDMLDISARTYTYIWTMTLAMEAAAEAGIPFIILDRPNPVTGRVGGPLPTLAGLRTGPKITGHFPVPFRHGMTPGEIGRYVNAEYAIGAQLTVVPMEGWRRTDWYDATGLPWVNPSPNIRSLDAALNFGGLGTLEATALSLGRGTSDPFSLIGAPWLDVDSLLRRLGQYSLRGVQLEPTRFTPSGEGWMQFRGQTVPGVRLRIVDRDQYDPSYLALVLLTEIYRLHPRNLGMREMKHILDDWTTAEIRSGVSPDRIAERWAQADQEWARMTTPYRLYD